MKRTLIRCGYVVSMDDDVGDMRDAEMLIGEDRILAIGKRLDAAHDELIDASAMIAMPGLVNMHLHTFQTGLRALGSEWTPADYFAILYGDIATRFTPQDNYIGTLAGALNQLDCGVTTLFDYCHNLRSLEQAEASAEALEQSGIRAVFGHGDGIKPPGTPGAPAAEKRLHPRDRAQALRQGRFASNDRRVTMALAIAGPHWADWETSLHNVRLGKELGLLVSSHVTKPRQLAVVPDGYERLAALGLLGEDHNLVHCNFLEREEIARLVGTGASITTTNLAELHDHASGPATLRVLQGGGLPSLGGDVEPMTTADMFREMQAALLHARHQSLREASVTGAVPTAIPIRSREALRWATMGGAVALRMQDKIGSLTPGKKADIVFVRVQDLNLWPVHDPVFAIVEQAHAGNVDTVIVDGITRKACGRLQVDAAFLSRLRTELQASASRLIGEWEERRAK